MISKALSVLLLVGVVAAQYNYQKPPPPQKPTNTYLPPQSQAEKAAQPLAPAAEHEPGNPFDFTYSVKEDDGTDHDHKASSNGDVVKGEYRTLLPDGRTQIVKYTADWKNGYNAEVIYEGEAVYPEPKPTPARSQSHGERASSGLSPPSAGYPKQTPARPYSPPVQRPAPKAPTSLYNTPTQSFGARNSPKFGYSK